MKQKSNNFMQLLLVAALVMITAIFFGNRLVTQRKNKVNLNLKEILYETDLYQIKANYENDEWDKDHIVENFVLEKVEAKREEWKEGGDIYQEELKVGAEYPDRPKMTYEYMISSEKYFSEERKTVSYVLTTYEFTGGAHGNSLVNSFTFDQNGKLEIDQILNVSIDDNDIKLLRIIAEKILANENNMTDEDMVMEGLGLAYLKADGKTLDHEKCNCDGFFFGSSLQNFYVKDEGMTFLYDQYDVAPGAAGIVKVELSNEELSDFWIY